MLVEQANDKPFNRAWLLNIGIAEAKKRFPAENTCVVTHDIDMIADSKNHYEAITGKWRRGAVINCQNFIASMCLFMRVHSILGHVLKWLWKKSDLPS